jgi:hypothetical protein
MGDLEKSRMRIKHDPADLCVMVIYPPFPRRDEDCASPWFLKRLVV